MDILVTGGVGYVGSHAALRLQEKGYTPIIVDNFSRSSKRYAEKYLHSLKVIESDIGDKKEIEKILQYNVIKGIVHFAAYAYVGESAENPSLYYENNVAKSISFLQAVLSFYKNNSIGVPPIIFSSTCSIYGETAQRPINEQNHAKPLNPYGRSKLIIEDILKDLSKYKGIKSICFRYFNAAGADKKLRAGEVHNPETHLIPLLINNATKKVKKDFYIYGNDYPTKDGTCIHAITRT